MAALLEKLGKEKSKNENLEIRRENETQKAGTDAGRTSAPSTAEIPVAACGVCGSVIAWWDRYGGGPHCHRCRDWPSRSLVAAIAVAHEGRWRSFDDMRAIGAAGSRSDAADASCGHRRCRNLAVWPVTDRGGILVPDFERVAEVESFVECADCEKWFLVSEFQEFGKQKGL